MKAKIHIFLIGRYLGPEITLEAAECLAVRMTKTKVDILMLRDAVAAILVNKRVRVEGR